MTIGQTSAAMPAAGPVALVKLLLAGMENVFNVQVSAVPTSYSYQRIYTAFYHFYPSKLKQ